ncbi:MAG: methyltransferase domain-containing protein [Leptolyngbyaceae cyanobacterium MAG.088]|nr:methyltransferase domain-containing protein [Leptolyngbyaceae cyanobacterium MAG.088]
MVKSIVREPLLEPLLRQFRLAKVMPYVLRGQPLLDIGCGKSATFLRAMSSQVSEGYGVDFKVNSGKIGKNVYTQQLTFLDKLPFDDAQFSTVTMLAVLEHIANETDMLDEIYRVLRPGGKLVLTVPSIWAKPVLEFLSYKLGIISEAEIRDHKRYYTRERLRRCLIDNGDFTDFIHKYFQLWMNNFCVVTKPNEF